MRNKPERVTIIASVAQRRGNQQQVCSFAFSYEDLREVRWRDSQLEVRGNDGHGWPSYRAGDVARAVLGVRFS